LRIKLGLILFIVLAIGLGQTQTQRVYEQSVRTSTSYSTQVLTTSTTQIFTVTMTRVSTIIYPPPPDLVVKYSYTRWYWTATTDLSRVEIYGNITNRSNLVLFQVKLKFRIEAGDKSESFTHFVSGLGAGQMQLFHFEYKPTQQYDYRWTYVRYLGFDYDLLVPAVTTIQTIVVLETSGLVKPVTTTTVHAIPLTYTQPAAVKSEGLDSSLMIMAVVAIVAVAVAVVTVLRSKTARKPSALPISEPISPPPEVEVEKQRYCIHCGKALPVDSEFCYYCGKRQ